jgi:hypothetical protein
VLGGGLELLVGEHVSVVRGLVHEGQQVADELPAVHTEALDVALHLGCLQAHALGHHQAGAAADPVRLHPLQVTVAGHLLVLGAVPIDADRASAGYEVYLLVRGQVLQVLDPPVETDLLLVALHLLVRGLVGGELELTAHNVCDEHRQGLGGTARGPDGAGEVDVRIAGAIVVLLDLNLGYALQGSHENALGEDGQPRPDGLVQRLLLVGEGPGLDDLHGDEEGGLLPVPALGGIPDLLGDPLGAHQVLDPLGQVRGNGDLDHRLGIVSLLPGPPRDLDALVEAAG